MSCGTKLFYRRKLYDLDKTDALFVEAVKENIRYHQKLCPEYNKIPAGRSFSPNDLNTIGDIGKIPPIPTLFSKNHPMYSASPEHLMFKSTTSGTSGKVSELGLDWTSARRGLGMMGIFSSAVYKSHQPGQLPEHMNGYPSVNTGTDSSLPLPYLLLDAHD